MEQVSPKQIEIVKKENRYQDVLKKDMRTMGDCEASSSYRNVDNINI